MSLIPYLIPLGLLSGLLAGLLGIGGGFVIVPGLYFLLRWKLGSGFDTMHIAITTSLVSTFFTTVVSSWAYHRRKCVSFACIFYLVPGLIAGCVSGAFIASFLSSGILAHIFAVLAILIGGYFCMPRNSMPKLFSKPNPLLLFFGALIGALSSFLGIGGGILTVPLLYSYGLSPLHSAGTSSVSTLITCFAGSLAFWIISQVGGIPSLIDWSAVLGITLGSVCTAGLGVHLAHQLPEHAMKLIFGIALALTGVCMLIL